MGVQSPRVPWQQSTLAAEQAHTQGVQQAVANRSFSKGVAKTSEQAWQSAASGKGADRFGPGAAAAEGDYERGFAPFRAVIESVSLPPRGPKGDPKNYERVRAMGTALRNAKLGK